MNEVTSQAGKASDGPSCASSAAGVELDFFGCCFGAFLFAIFGGSSPCKRGSTMQIEAAPAAAVAASAAALVACDSAATNSISDAP